MANYPQLLGAMGQFPALKRRRLRTVANALADGGWVKAGDPGAQVTEWALRYAGLSDAEVAELANFFAVSEGSLNAFTFLDPAGNLLAWSENFANGAWTAGPLLSTQGGVADPLGGTAGWHLTNNGGVAQALQQTINAPGEYTYCFSVYARSAQTGTAATLTIGSARTTVAIGREWARFSMAATGETTGTSVTFGIELPNGGAADVFGPEVDAQISASRYQRSTGGGVYAGARFRDDELTFTAEAPNRNSTVVNIIHVNHL